MQVKISTENKVETERLIMLLSMGLAKAIKESLISIDDAEKLLFSPYSAQGLEEMDKDVKDITKIIYLGCELEDVLSLIPHELDSSLNDIMTLCAKKLRQLPAVDNETKKWLDYD